MYEEYEDGSGGCSPRRKIALGVGVLAVVLLGWFVVTNLTGGKDGGQVKQGAATASSEAPSSTAAGDDEAAATTEATEAPADSKATATTEAEPEATTTPTTAEATTAAPTTVAPTAAPTTVADTTPPPPTNPDGSPAWVTAIYDTNSITLNGQVPDADSKAKLESLAVANARDDTQRSQVINNL